MLPKCNTVLLPVELRLVCMTTCNLGCQFDREMLFGWEIHVQAWRLYSDTRLRAGMMAITSRK